MVPDRIFGEIPDVAEGDQFSDRQEVRAAGVHRPTQHGISGSQTEGADSIVVSGGYEDDEDYGDLIIYTGHGGRDPTSGKQIADQTLTAQNLALAVSSDLGLPVRVVRGSRGDPTHSPASGYRYDGLFYVDQYWREQGRSGFFVWRFKLIREPMEASPGGVHDAGGPVKREQVTVQRQIRSTAVTNRVKRIHHFLCQICGERIETAAGYYAEGAHIRPLGRPHDGSDSVANVLCLCPNDHVRFDRGAIYIDDAMKLRDSATDDPVGTLFQHDAHKLDPANIQYHRDLWRNVR